METRSRSSLRNAGGVAAILHNVQERAKERLQKRLIERIEQGRSNLSEEEVETLVRIAAQITREECANAVAEAFQEGINSTAKPEDFERDTLTPKKG